jgi:hypothetical protein
MCAVDNHQSSPDFKEGGTIICAILHKGRICWLPHRHAPAPWIEREQATQSGIGQVQLLESDAEILSPVTKAVPHLHPLTLAAASMLLAKLQLRD